MQIGPLTLERANQSLVMGILNVTPDSFTDGGTHNTVDSALTHCEYLLAEGADIIDIGAESTRPGHEQISVGEEIKRLLPVLEAVRAKYPKAAISVDCYRADTARAALTAGADMINDIWGLTYDPEMAGVIAEHDAAVCITHNRADANYRDLINDIKNDLSRQIDIAKNAGIDRTRICIDPGIGFAKSWQQNLIVLRHLEELQMFDLPILLGTSRKGFLSKILGGSQAQERDLATAVTNALGYEKGCRIFRVHDVKKTKEALAVVQAIMEA